MSSVFLDNGATTRIHPAVLDAMMPYLTDRFGNPSGLHSFAREAQKALSIARETVAEVLHCTEDEITFTSGGTESNNLAILGTARRSDFEKGHFVTSAIEHPSVLEPIRSLQNTHDVTLLRPNREGAVDAALLRSVLSNEKIFVSLLYVQNEIGTVHPLASLSEVVHARGGVFHTDGCQAPETQDLDVTRLGVDMMTLNGSKIHAPKGVGALYHRKGVALKPLLLGGGQEKGLRSGTENIAGIVGFAAALKLASDTRKHNVQHFKRLQMMIRDFIMREIPLARLNGDPDYRNPANVHYSFLNTEGESLVLMLDDLGYAVATGSACSSADLQISHVLKGIGMPHEIAHGSLRVVLAYDTTEANVRDFLVALKATIERVRAISSVHFDASDFPGWF